MANDVEARTPRRGVQRESVGGSVSRDASTPSSLAGARDAIAGHGAEPSRHDPSRRVGAALERRAVRPR